MKYNGMMNSHFAGHALLAEMRNEPMKRDVKVYEVGEPDVVGISDGVDAWIASPKSCLKRLHLEERLAAFLAGGRVSTRRRALLVQEEAPIVRRRVVHVE